MTWDQTIPIGAFGPPDGSIEIRNLSGLVTGILGRPLVPAATIRAESGVITAIGGTPSPADVVLDANGAIAVPGLIDTHSHVVFGDYTPRQNAIGWLESYMHGGVTQVMSASEVHLPGRPSDRAGLKALAIVAQRAYATFRPGGVRVRGGSVICEPVLDRSDFEELAAAGVRLMKVGFGAFRAPADAAPQVAWAREFHFVVMSHSGGTSIPGSMPITVDDLLAIDPDIAGHVNGGTTSLPDEDLLRLIDESSMALQVVQAGNLRSALHVVGAARERGALDRVILGTDTPSGTGVMPLGLIKTICEISSLGEIAAVDAIAFATGNAAQVLRVSEGVLDVGRAADLVLLQAPAGAIRRDALGSIENGDIPGISAVVIEGQVRALTSRNSPAPARETTVLHAAG
jgi:enamidase